MANVEKLRYLRDKQRYQDLLDRHYEWQQRKEEAAENHRLASAQQDAYIADLDRKLDKETKSMIIRFFG